MDQTLYKIIWWSICILASIYSYLQYTYFASTTKQTYPTAICFPKSTKLSFNLQIVHKADCTIDA